VKFPDSGELANADIFLILRSLFIVAGDGGAWHDVRLSLVIETFGDIFPKYEVPRVGLFVPLPLQLLPDPMSLSLVAPLSRYPLQDIARGEAIIQNTTSLVQKNSISSI